MVALALSLIAIIIAVGVYVGQRHLYSAQEIKTLNSSLLRVETVLNRMELYTRVVAADVSTAKSTVETVAEKLKASQTRADEVTNGKPGEAADAGAQSGS